MTKRKEREEEQMKHNSEGTHYFCNVHKDTCCGCNPREECIFESKADKMDQEKIEEIKNDENFVGCCMSEYCDNDEHNEEIAQFILSREAELWKELKEMKDLVGDYNVKEAEQKLRLNQAVKLLKRLEWEVDYEDSDTRYFCSNCGDEKPKHRNNCSLSKFLEENK